jgi:hypothetical protein
LELRDIHLLADGDVDLSEGGRGSEPHVAPVVEHETPGLSVGPGVLDSFDPRCHRAAMLRRG